MHGHRQLVVVAQLGADLIEKIDGLVHGGQRMEAIRACAAYPKAQIDLGGNSDGCSGHRSNLGHGIELPQVPGAR